MKRINSKFKHLEEINNIGIHSSSRSNFTNLKRNQKSFYQSKTNSTNFSLEQSKIKNSNTPERKIQKKTELMSLRKNESTKIGLKKPIISISISDKGAIKKKENPIQLKPLLPTNVNPLQHLIRANTYGVFENLNWVLRLRDTDSKGKINLTNNFHEPSFYVEDLEKYKKKQKKNSEQKIIKLNPNYNKIKHLVLGNNTGNTNYSQFNFSTCLREYNNNDINKNNIEKENKWKITPLPKLKCDNYTAKFLAPITPNGIQNVKKLEKFMPKNYEINHGEAIVGNDTIKKKILVSNRSYTVSGYGDCLGVPKYDNKFRDNNMFPNKIILKTETNPFSKFELGLRNYGTHQNLNHFNKNNIRKNS